MHKLTNNSWNFITYNTEKYSFGSFSKVDGARTRAGELQAKVLQPPVYLCLEYPPSYLVLDILPKIVQTDTRITPHSGIAICKFNTLSQDETPTCFPSIKLKNSPQDETPTCFPPIKLKNSLSVLLNLSAMKLRTALRWIFHPLWRKHQTARHASTSSERCSVSK